MPKYAPIHKRVKRHVIGREHHFFVAAPPALAGLIDRELRQLLVAENELQRRPGGFGFRGRLTDAYRINLQSRLSNRVLMQVSSFKATSFRRLAQKLSELPWELYLYGESALKIRVSTHKCRLYHSSAIAERAQEQVRRQLAQFGLAPVEERHFDQVQHLFIRGVNDRFSVSVDSSGDHLYKRGIKTHGGRAPLRENLAAAVLQLAGYDGQMPLLDPMCGSGTFSLEAALMAANIPPGWFRRFAFMEWPSFVDRRWQHLRKQHEAVMRKTGKAAILAFDIDGAACEALKQTLRRHHVADWITVDRKDFFDFSPGEWTGSKGVVVLNPPYGRRFTTAADQSGLDSIFKQLTRFYKGWRLALVSPRKSLNRKLPFEVKIYPIAHGGLAAAVAIGEIT